MADEPTEPTPNKFSTATIAGLTLQVFAVLAPFIHAAGQWITAHSSVTFSEQYMDTLQGTVVALVTAYVVHRHSDS